MVNFDNITSTGLPATEIEKINILHLRHNVIVAIEHYKIKKYSNASINLCYVKAYLLSLILQMQATLKRNLDSVDYDLLLKIPDNSKTIDELMNGFFILSEMLDKMRITKLDNMPTYDTKRVVEANKFKGGAG